MFHITPSLLREKPGLSFVLSIDASVVRASNFLFPCLGKQKTILFENTCVGVYIPLFFVILFFYSTT